MLIVYVSKPIVDVTVHVPYQHIADRSVNYFHLFGIQLDLINLKHMISEKDFRFLRSPFNMKPFSRMAFHSQQYVCTVYAIVHPTLTTALTSSVAS